MQHFGDADHRHFVVVRDQLDARLRHPRPAHAEKLRAGPLAQCRTRAARHTCRSKLRPRKSESAGALMPKDAQVSREAE